MCVGVGVGGGGWGGGERKRCICCQTIVILEFMWFGIAINVVVVGMLLFLLLLLWVFLWVFLQLSIYLPVCISVDDWWLLVFVVCMFLGCGFFCWCFIYFFTVVLLWVFGGESVGGGWGELGWGVGCIGVLVVVVVVLGLF